MAKIHERQGRLSDAKQLFEKILAEHSTNATASHRLAVINSQLGQHELARNYFLSALTLDADNSELLTDFGFALYLDGDLDGATAALEKSVAKTPRNRRSLNMLAMVVGRQGNFDRALDLFKQAGDESEAHANIAYVYMQSGDASNAEIHYAKALSLKPEMGSAVDALIQIAEMKAVYQQNSIEPTPGYRSDGEILTAGHQEIAKPKSSHGEIRQAGFAK